MSIEPPPCEAASCTVSAVELLRRRGDRDPADQRAIEIIAKANISYGSWMTSSTLHGLRAERLSFGKRSDFDVVAFTHGDEDHIKGAADFFELEHADKYCGKDRIKMCELWVPAAINCLDSRPKQSLRSKAGSRWRSPRSLFSNL